MVSGDWVWIEAWSDGEGSDGTYSDIFPNQKGCWGLSSDQRKGRPCRETAWLVQSPHNHHLATPDIERWVAPNNPLCSSPKWGIQGLLPSAGDVKCFFTVVLSWEQPDSAWLARVSW